MRLTLLSFSPSHPLPSLSPLFLHPPHTFLLTPPSSTPPPHTENDQPSLVWFDRGKFYLTFEGKFSLHQASVHTHTHSLSRLICASFSPPLPCPFFPPSPLLFFLPCNPSITLTHAMLTPGWGPSYAVNYAVSSSCNFSSWHCSFSFCLRWPPFIHSLKNHSSSCTNLFVITFVLLVLWFLVWSLDCLIFFDLVRIILLQQHVWNKHAHQSQSLYVYLLTLLSHLAMLFQFIAHVSV